MKGNSAILKCLIPSFVADFVFVTAWVDSDGDEYIINDDYDRGKVGIDFVTAKMKGEKCF